MRFLKSFSKKEKNNSPEPGTLEYVRDYAKNTHPLLNNRKDILIGDYSYGNPKIRTGAGMAKCVIGKFCCIASDVSIQLISDHHPDWISTYDLSILLNGSNLEKAYNRENCVVKGDVVIGNNVWIGERVIILPGVTIGDGAIIGAGSVVTKPVPAYSTGGGVPFRVFKNRFSPQEIDILEEIQWWNWDDAKLLKGLKFIESNDVNALLKFHREYKED